MFTLDSLRAESFSWTTALSLAAAAKLSYEPDSVVRGVATATWGFSSVEILDSHDTQGFIARTDGAILIAFRGSESLADWLSNMNVLTSRQPYGDVHTGFLKCYRFVQDKIVAALAPAATGGKKIWLTGHSLGGALATIAAAELRGAAAINGIYTYGQPRMGKAALKTFVERHFADRFFRFVNNEDLVTRVPWGFSHVGKLIYFDAQGNLRDAPSELESAAVEPPALTEEQFEAMQRDIEKVRGVLHERAIGDQEGVINRSIEGLIPGLSDHGLDGYIAGIRRAMSRGTVDSGVAIERAARSVRSERAARSAAPDSDLESMGSVRRAVRGAAELIPVLLRLKDTNWTPPSGLKVNSRLGTIVSAQISADELRVLDEDPNVVSIEASREGGKSETATSIPFVGGDQIHGPPIGEKGDKAIVGLIDSGVDVLHEAFRDAGGKTRILAFWAQADESGSPPRAVDGRFTQDYGTLYTAADIDKFIAGAALTPPLLRDDKETHGTLVASIAAGRGAGTFSGGMAPEAKLAVVAPFRKTAPGDPPSLGYSSSHVDALSFLKILHQGGNSILQNPLPMAVNVSLGMNAGAHDGKSNLEVAFDQATGGGKDPGFAIVKSAGNERGHGGHARVKAFNGAIDIDWRSLPRPRPQDYIEVWYNSLNELTFALVDPQGNQSAVASRSNPKVQTVLGGNSCLLHLTEFHPDNGDSRLLLTILAAENEIQPGRWSLKVVGTNVRGGEARVDAWAERYLSRAIRFEDDEPEITLSIPGTVDTVITVGACHSAAPLTLIDASSFGPCRDSRPKPDLCAPGFEIAGAAAGLADHQAVRSDIGTSFAAPHVTGALALVLSHRHKQTAKPQYNANQLRKALIQTVKNFSGVHHEGFGYGVLDAAKFFEKLR